MGECAWKSYRLKLSRVSRGHVTRITMVNKRKHVDLYASGCEWTCFVNTLVTEKVNCPGSVEHSPDPSVYRLNITILYSHSALSQYLALPFITQPNHSRTILSLRPGPESPSAFPSHQHENFTAVFEVALGGTLWTVLSARGLDLFSRA